MISTKKCLICNKGGKNDVLHWHIDPDDGSIWCWCCKCDRGYSLHSYCAKAGLSLTEFLKADFDFKESPPNEVNAQHWPSRFISLLDERARKGVAYIKGRGLTLEGDMYYDVEREGIVFPYYFGDQFVGAQMRFINPHFDAEGEPQKMDTLPGTRLGLLFYNWNQTRFVGDVKAIVVCEGAFNALSIQQSLNLMYGGIANNPWRCICCSGSGATPHQREAMKELKDNGLRIVIAPDQDDAGMKMLRKFNEAGACTHYALTGEDADWNDKLKELGHQGFAKFFLNCIKKA